MRSAFAIALAVVFYWLAVLVTFALGTAAIGLISAAYRGLRLGAVPAFWAAYIITRPLGASAGDLLTAPRSSGGLGLNSTVVNVVFLGTIIVLVSYLSRSRVDQLDQAQ
ncbi:MAG: hypothetical protein WAW85_13325 [Gordonia sp. (in: high G+C Gram-positive bacteria)]|uniref:hypothetical protein n=1 Tax=Gordonia sp. (in: high G+C Gram-positive bacteria) TaxID=84139 RepID=UPI003BB567C8